MLFRGCRIGNGTVPHTVPHTHCIDGELRYATASSFVDDTRLVMKLKTTVKLKTSTHQNSNISDMEHLGMILPHIWHQVAKLLNALVR